MRKESNGIQGNQLCHFEGDLDNLDEDVDKCEEVSVAISHNGTIAGDEVPKEGTKHACIFSQLALQ